MDSMDYKNTWRLIKPQNEKIHKQNIHKFKQNKKNQ